MTTEDKALALVRNEDALGLLNFDAAIEALCRAIEQHEATKREFDDFKQKVSDAIRADMDCQIAHKVIPQYRINIARFYIPAPKPDPLLKAMTEALGRSQNYKNHHADALRDTLDALGFEIREKNDDTDN